MYNLIQYRYRGTPNKVYTNNTFSYLKNYFYVFVKNVGLWLVILRYLYYFMHDTCDKKIICLFFLISFLFLILYSEGVSKQNYSVF